MRYAIGLQYDGHAYAGWQTQPKHSGVRTVQDVLEHALSEIASERVSVVCAGRTDSGVHALQQTAHFDTASQRADFAWLRGTNALLPKDVSVRWVKPVADDFHARHSATARRYVYVLLSDPVRPALARHQVGWTHLPLNTVLMQQAADMLLGEHDFSTFRASECQALKPTRTLLELKLHTHGKAIFITTQANAYLHHMVRNIMGALVQVGSERWTLAQFKAAFLAKDRREGAPTFSADGLYFCGAHYPPHIGLPEPVLMSFEPNSQSWPWAL